MLEELKTANLYLREQVEKYQKRDRFFEKLNQLETEAVQRHIPIISPEVREYLKFILRNSEMKQVLEIGTAIGYSGIIIAGEIEKNNGRLYTIEQDPNRYEQAIVNFQECDLFNIKAICGDALAEILKIDQQFDLIFLDAAKSQYMELFLKSFQLLRKDGIVIIDNLLFRGYLYREYPKRYRSIVKHMEQFIKFLYQEQDDFVLLPFGDGLGIVRKTM